MDIGAGGTTIMVLIAACLWLMYLMPTWLRRREYLATERNATRLQQTLRIMAETAETPHAVHAEASARSVAQHQKALKRELERAAARAKIQDAAAARAAAAATLAAQRTAPALQIAPVEPVETKLVETKAAELARRRRRTKAWASTVLLLALFAFAVQAGLMSATGAVVGSWIVLASATLGGSLALAALQRLNSISRAQLPVIARYSEPLMQQLETAPVEPVSTWTPVPLPKPLYLSRPVAPPVVIVDPLIVDPADELRVAAAAAEAALRAVQASSKVAPISRFAAMGLVTELDQGRPDLDAVLRRRRAAG